MMTHHSYPIAVNHVGISVSDVVAAVEFYEEALSMRCIMGPRVLMAPTDVSKSPLGSKFRKAWQAHMMSANGVGLELFQFIEPPMPKPADEIEFWRPGTWHVCLTDPDVSARADRIVAGGGRKWHEPVQFVQGRPYQLVYCSDPWGTVIEVMSHPYAEVFASWPQPGMTAQSTYIDRASRTELPPQPLPDWSILTS